MNDGYSGTIALFRRSLSMSGCSVLQAHILDVLPKLAEQRARHYIKGAHGYFMGSWSDGNNGGSGGANSLKKVLDKSGKGGIIELGSEGMFRRKDPNKIEPMPKKQLRRIEQAFQRQGGVIQRGEAVDEYLEKRHAEGITYDAKTVLLRQKPSRASVLEEMIHTAQYRNGKNDGSTKSMILCEIEAQKKLLANSKPYKLTGNEIAQTKRALEMYLRQLDEYNIKHGGG